MATKPFDMAFIGAGCSSLQLMHQMASADNWHEQQVALFSHEQPQHRSWCFWSDKPHPLQFLVEKSWQNISFVSNGLSVTQNIAPYQYHYISGAGFFNYFQGQFLENHPNVTAIQAHISAVQNNESTAAFTVHNGTQQWAAKQVFNSLPPKIKKTPDHVCLQQHFKGWFLQTDTDAFDEDTVTMMDFSIEQHNDVRFVYILPFSKREALVEITVFSEHTYADAVYDEVFENYMDTRFSHVNYTIQNTEKASIPMTNAPFSRFGNTGEVLLGAAAGMVKATTGYAFNRISKDSLGLHHDLKQQRKLRLANTQGRFRFYDNLLLGILAESPQRGKEIFEALFSKMSIPTILKFLDEDTTLAEEMLIFSKLPFWPFLAQVFKQCILPKIGFSRS
ncbi:MAG: hypothetical protein EAZ32_13880 [Cytophagia bacterium]|nr:MAG: hypothetical protein EAZ46_08655 [Runella sp.]TAG37939.1 MAG: hypothetical protein EAZ32_13880 [Cytophagia bacterium]